MRRLCARSKAGCCREELLMQPILPPAVAMGWLFPGAMLHRITNLQLAHCCRPLLHWYPTFLWSSCIEALCCSADLYTSNPPSTSLSTCPYTQPSEPCALTAVWPGDAVRAGGGQLPEHALRGEQLRRRVRHRGDLPCAQGAERTVKPCMYTVSSREEPTCFCNLLNSACAAADRRLESS